MLYGYPSKLFIDGKKCSPITTFYIYFAFFPILFLLFVDCEFCVHSASVTTTDASIPTETSKIYAKATCSSVSTSKSETNTSTTTFLKRLPPASSIISSFFPSCKSQHSGQAVPSLALSGKSEFENNPKCMMGDSTLLNVSSKRTACDLKSSPPASRNGVDEKNLNPIQSDVSICQVSVSEKEEDMDSAIISESACDVHKNKILHPDCHMMKASNVEEQLKSDKNGRCDSDEEFEDCNSIVSEISLSSHKSYHSDEGQVESLSQEDDEWSDAEDNLSLEKDMSVSKEIHQVDLDKQSTVVEEDNLPNCPQSNCEPVLLLKPSSRIDVIRKFSLPEIDEATIYTESRSEICDQKERFMKKSNEYDSNVSDEDPVCYGGIFRSTTTFKEQKSSFQSNTKNKEEQTVIEPCEQEINKTCDSDEEPPFAMTAVSGESKTDFEMCAHGVELSSLCLLCLGYSINGLRLKPDCAIRLKAGYKFGNNSDEESKFSHSDFKREVEYIKPHLRKVGSTNDVDLDSKSCSHKPSCGNLSSYVADKSTKLSQTLPRRQKSEANVRQRKEIVPPHKTLPDGTVIYYWCDVPGGYISKSQNGMLANETLLRNLSNLSVPFWFGFHYLRLHTVLHFHFHSLNLFFIV